jgi:hypothetical protein
MKSCLKSVLHGKALKMKNPKKARLNYQAENHNLQDSQRKFLQKVFNHKLKAFTQNQ